ncbi:TPM domain-containing protein [Croceivirga thetidis]|uniref:TPM domain-containing protein n=1 Tax=Croceivirga thetidis TaxID=2721623 RepID=A0ABX1GNV2_9FLAO|nr:TPM domain-containing protein [Croceivirga thetidis]NKI31607.1 TPM domain-containing protein [Croceivirga thetidis]
MRVWLFRLFLFLLALNYGHSQSNSHQLTEIVTDQAGIFSASDLVQLQEKLTLFEQETTNQIVVLTVVALNGETIEQYALNVFNNNELGQKGKDNGVLILFAQQEREVRIEVGYGLEPYITDAVASRIIRETMIPRFKEERYFEGISAATDQIINFLDDPDALEEFKQETAQEEKLPIWVYLFLGAFFLIFVTAGGFYFYQTNKSFIKVLKDIFSGRLGVFPGTFILFFTGLSVLISIPFIIAPILIALVFFADFEPNVDSLLDNPYLILIPVLFYVFITSVIAIFKLKSGDEPLKFSAFKSDKSYFSKSYSSSGSSSGFSSSFGGGSSSFSGGGGSSGGGGASGSW